MIPQSNFMILAPIRAERRQELEALLEKMNLDHAKGMADPNNAGVPFARIETVHFARFVIIDDRTLIDFRALGMPVPNHPVSLAFLGECDGPAQETLKRFASDPGTADGLRQVFSHVEGFQTNQDLNRWMQDHNVRPAATYINWLGRTVKQIRQQDRLYEAVRGELIQYGENPNNMGADPVATYAHLKAFVRGKSGLMPDDEASTPINWLISDLAHFLMVPIALTVPWILAFFWFAAFPPIFWITLIPFVILTGIGVFYTWRKTNTRVAILAGAISAALYCLFVFPWFLLWVLVATIAFLIPLRCYERNEPEIIPRMPAAAMDRHVERLAEREDHDVTNQFTVVGSVKPGRFRYWLARALFWLINYGARHFYRRGHLARIQTIHFARWTYIDGQRVVFTSNYDGSLDAYMDDFINKVGWGLNLAFGCGLGYPRVNWLIGNGSKEEQKFKYTLRRHQLPTQVWYKAYPGLTAVDLARNTRVHQGLKRDDLTRDEIITWLGDL